MNNVLTIIVILIATLLLICLVWIVKTERRAENKPFLSGSLPIVETGFYKGNDQISSTWQGKKFTPEKSSGINVFSDGERYTFKTYAKSYGNKQRLVLDYDVSGNPWWIRLIVDEMVEVEPGQYQGKVYAKIGPLKLPVTYFQLQKP